MIIKSSESDKVKKKVIEWIDDLLNTKDCFTRLIQQNNINLIDLIFDDLLNTKYYFTLYGEKLLKSAIEYENTKLIDVIFKKTIKYFKENQKSHFYILSIISNNIPYLKKYPEFILRYHNEVPFVLYPTNKKIIYNNFNHLDSFCIELEINKLFIIPWFIFYRKKILFSIHKILLLLCIFMVIYFYLRIISNNFHNYKFDMKYRSIYIITMTIICIFFYKKYKKYGWLLIKIIITLSFIFIILGIILYSNLTLIGTTMVGLSFLLYIFYITYREKKGLWIQKIIFISFIFLVNLILISVVDYYWIYIFLFILFAIILIIIFYILHPPNPIKPNFIFLTPFPCYNSYTSKYDWFKEFFIKPRSSPFIETDNIEFYKTWNSEALINFKWRMYGNTYYIGICLLYAIFFTCFIISIEIDIMVNIGNDFILATILFEYFQLLF